MDLKQEISVVTQRLMKYQNDFFLFCSEVLGLNSKVPGHYDLNSVHGEMCQELSQGKRKFKLFLIPRHTFKSTIGTIGYSLWRLLYNPDLRILIYSDATTKAQGFLNGIKSHILGKSAGSKLRDYFGAWETDSHTGKWNDSQILINRRRTSHVEPSVETAGVGTSLTGRHYDIIIFDDIVSDINVTTKDQMDKVVECYKKALSLLKPGGEVIMIGTRWHFGDCYGRIIAENDTTEVFSVMVKDAEEKTEEGKLLFEDVGLDRKFLNFQRQQQGSYLYSCLYRNNPVDDETSVFKAKDFSFYGAVKPEDLYMTCCVDPAGEGKDYTGITVVGTDSNMDLYVLEAIAKHLQPSQIVDTVINLNYKYRFQMVGIEINFFRGMLKAELRRRTDEERENPMFHLFGIREFEAQSRKGTGKHTRILALQPLHERGALKFPGDRLELLKGDFSTLAYQMLQYTHDGPKSPHDDLLDSLAYHPLISHKGGVVKKADPPKFTPAWLEKRALDMELERNNRLPRRFRRQVDTSLVFS